MYFIEAELLVRRAGYDNTSGKLNSEVCAIHKIHF